MVSTFLTPVTLWKDFDDSLPLEEHVLSEEKREGAVFQDIVYQTGDVIRFR